jgi:hypothetical protein
LWLGIGSGAKSEQNLKPQSSQRKPVDFSRPYGCHWNLIR